MSEVLTLKETSTYLRVPIATLRSWRSRGTGGPRSFKLAGRVAYLRSDVENWIQEQYQESQRARA